MRPALDPLYATSDAERWQRVEPVLAEALDLPIAERRRFLDRACGDDRAMRREVEELLEACEQADNFIEDPAFDVAMKWEDRPGRAAAGIGHEAKVEAGADFGPYRVLKPIGEGGMGVVYLAERGDDVYRRQVAVKVLRASLPSDAWARRFRHERQILAQLDHPHIARLLDGGTSHPGPHPESRPFLVMEYIEGQPIDAFCDARRLPIDARLTLFRKVCDAVRYAHRNLVVHRDIKPRNILVTAEGDPKLLDFGIAKLLDPTMFAITAEATHTGAQPMTPQYASPEQLAGQPTTTAVDVYALGLLLFKLTAGCLPYRLTSVTPQQVEAVLGGELVRPSAALDLDDVDPGRISELRGVSTQQLRRQLEGDLDNIIVMALRREPERRYSSVEQLAEDLRRHQVGLPVMARQDKFGYRSAKFLSRHRLAVAITGLIFSLLLVFAFTMARQTARITEQAAQLANERDRAETERAKAQEVSDFLVDLFRVSQPSEALGREVTARQLLDEGASKIERELRDQPLVQANLMDVIGAVYGNLRLFDESKPLLENALEARTRLLGNQHPVVADSLQNLGANQLAKGELAAAEPLYRQALEIRERVFGGEHLSVAETLNDLGVLFRRTDRLQEAERVLLRALDIRQTQLGDNHPKVAESLNNLGMTLQDQGRYGDSYRLLQRSLAIQQQLLPANHPELATAVNNVAYSEMELGQFVKAEAMFRSALAIRDAVLEADDPLLAVSLNNLALVLTAVGRFDEAEELYHRSRRIWEQSSNGSGRVAVSFYCLATLHTARGDLEAAEALYLRAITRLEELHGPDNLRLAQPTCGLARNHRMRLQLDRAEGGFRRCLAILQGLPADQQARTWTQKELAAAYLGLGNVLHLLGRDSDARDAWRQAVTLIEPVAQRFPIVRYLDIQALALLHLGQVEEGAPIARKLLAIGWSNPDLRAAVKGLDRAEG